MVKRRKSELNEVFFNLLSKNTFLQRFLTNLFYFSFKKIVYYWMHLEFFSNSLSLYLFCFNFLIFPAILLLLFFKRILSLVIFLCVCFFLSYLKNYFFIFDALFAQLAMDAHV